MSTWRVALRIARRDVVRARGRSLLIAVLVGLPVLVACAADVLARSGTLDPVDLVAARLGDRAQARLSGFDPGMPVMHNTEGAGFVRDDRVPAVASSQPSSQVEEERARAVLAGVLPARDRLVRDLLWTPRQWMSRDGRELPMSIRELDYADPGLAGLIRQVSGRPPAAAGEVVIPVGTAREYGLGPGATLTLPDGASGTGRPGRTLTVVGLVQPAQRTSPGFPVMMANGWVNSVASSRLVPPTYVSTATGQAGRYVIGRPGDLIPRNRATADASEASWYVTGPDPVGWDQVRALNRLGTVVVSRALLLTPPPESQVPLADRWRLHPERTRADLAAIGPVVAGLVVLQVALTAGSAFAVGTRRSRRSLALIAAVGGQRPQLWAVVLANALIIGSLAAVVSAAAGVGLGAAMVWWLRSVGAVEAPRLEVCLLDVAVLIGAGTLAAVMAALVPARQAARADVVPALADRHGTDRRGTDRRGQAPPRLRLPVLGLLLAAAGAGLALWAAVAASSSSSSSIVLLRSLVVLGVGIGEVGLLLTVGAVVTLAAQVARWLPVAARWALRDAARQRSRTAPAVAAVMAVLAGATSVTLFVLAMNEKGRRDYRPHLATGALWAGNATAGAALNPADLQRLRSRLPEVLPVADVATLQYPSGPDGEPATVDPLPPAGVPCPPADGAARVGAEQSNGVRRCDPYQGRQPRAVGPIVDDGSACAVLTGAADPGAAAALRAGQVVVFAPHLLWPDGTVHLAVRRPPAGSPTGRGRAPWRTVVLPGYVSSAATVPAPVVIPPSRTAALGLTARPDGVIAPTTRFPTDEEMEQAALAVRDLADGGRLGFYLEGGYPGPLSGIPFLVDIVAVLVALTGTVAAVGLAAEEGRADIATLVAVGAGPGIPRRTGAAQAAVIATIGTVMGLASGTLGGVALIRMMGTGRDGWPLVLPWTALVAVGLGVPLLATAAGFLVTRSPLPLVRRLGQ